MASARGPYRSTYLALVTDPGFQRLTSDARLTLWTLKHTDLGNVAGIFPLYREALEIQTALNKKRLQLALDELEEGRWIQIADGLVWGRNFLRFDPTYTLADPNKKKGIENLLRGLPKVGLVRRFAEYYEVECPEGVPAYVEEPNPQGENGIAGTLEGATEGATQAPLKPPAGAGSGSGSGTGTGDKGAPRSPHPPSVRTQAREVLRFWKASLDHPKAIESEDRLRKIEARLNEGHTPIDLMWACCGCGMSDFHMGQNDRRRIYDSVELIFRSASKVEELQREIGEQDARRIIQDWRETGKIRIPQHLRGSAAPGVASG
jgi:hypothetical protein